MVPEKKMGGLRRLLLSLGRNSSPSSVRGSLPEPGPPHVFRPRQVQFQVWRAARSAARSQSDRNQRVRASLSALSQRRVTTRTKSPSMNTEKNPMPKRPIACMPFAASPGSSSTTCADRQKEEPKSNRWSVRTRSDMPIPSSSTESQIPSGRSDNSMPSGPSLAVSGANAGLDCVHGVLQQLAERGEHVVAVELLPPRVSTTLGMSETRIRVSTGHPARHGKVPCQLLWGCLLP